MTAWPPATEEVPVEERCWAAQAVIAGPAQPCQRRGEDSLGLCPFHRAEIAPVHPTPEGDT